MLSIKQKISLAICAYNEKDNIKRVLDVVNKVAWLDQIIVVDDGSNDGTHNVVRAYKKIDLVIHPKNKGKGGAIATAIKVAKNDLMVFLDADLLGLTESHLLEMISPVLFTKQADLCLGVFGKGEISATNIANKLLPSITGQRAVWKNKLPNRSKMQALKYGVDLFITNSFKPSRIKIVKLDGLSQIIKEEKSKELVQAVKNRVIMYKDIYKTAKKTKKKKFIKN